MRQVWAFLLAVFFFRIWLVIIVCRSYICAVIYNKSK